MNERGVANHSSVSPLSQCSEAERRWFEDQFDKKTDKEVFNLKTGEVQKDVDELKKDLGDLKKDVEKIRRDSMDHSCKKEDMLNEIKKSIESFKKIKIGTLAAIFVIVIAGVGNYFGFKNTVDNNSAALAEIKVSIDDLRKSQQILKEELNFKRGGNDIDLVNIKNALEELIELEKNRIRKKKK